MTSTFDPQLAVIMTYSYRRNTDDKKCVFTIYSGNKPTDTTDFVTFPASTVGKYHPARSTKKLPTEAALNTRYHEFSV